MQILVRLWPSRIENRRNEDAATNVVRFTDALMQRSRMGLREHAIHADGGMRLGGQYPFHEPIEPFGVWQLCGVLSNECDVACCNPIIKQECQQRRSTWRRSRPDVRNDRMTAKYQCSREQNDDQKLNDPLTHAFPMLALR